jgi:hypothetical protein
MSKANRVYLLDCGLNVFSIFGFIFPSISFYNVNGVKQPTGFFRLNALLAFFTLISVNM